MHHRKAVIGVALALAISQTAAATAAESPPTTSWQCQDWTIDVQSANATIGYNKNSVNLPVVLDAKPGLVMAGRLDGRPLYYILVLDLEKSTFAVTEVSTHTAASTKVHKCNRPTGAARP
ncbi:hypothetical protein IP70_22205 [alpha proteobacterium AAP38]|uniref:hypothetical protein n=1 Tax=Asticcacaulis sp. TaxID=1872648 RepID=UPI0006BA05D9|nr:hypothetical protein [Asticcacaulis sp.]KPF82191.1 hypothetical protein IP70_22205 [alpha proteobacterium AAP38]